MTCKAAIERTKEAVPAEATLIAFFDNALPNSYSSIRQLVRRQKHETLLQHYTDYQDMVRGELASRRPTPSAYNATQGNLNPGDANPGGPWRRSDVHAPSLRIPERA